MIPTRAWFDLDKLTLRLAEMYGAKDRPSYPVLEKTGDAFMRHIIDDIAENPEWYAMNPQSPFRSVYASILNQYQWDEDGRR